MILKAKPYWAAFNASSYIKELASGNIWMVHGYSNDIFQADKGAQEAKQNFRVRHSLPKEGAVLALDVMVVAKARPGRPGAPVHQLHARGAQLRRPYQHDRLAT